MGRVQAYRVAVRIALTTLLLLASAAVAPAQTNPAAPEVAPPIRYNRYIQLHQVPVDIKSPAQLRREEEQARDHQRVERVEPTLPSLDIMTPPPARLPPRSTGKRGAADSPWPDEGQQDGAEREKDQDRRANWGWLADDVRKAEERRSETRDQAAEDDADQDAATGATNQTARAERDWSDRRDTAAAGASLIRPAGEPRMGRAFEASDRQPGERDRNLMADPGDFRTSDRATPADQAPTVDAARPPDWMLASAALVPDTPIGRSILGSGATAERAAVLDPRTAWTGLASPGAPLTGSGGLLGGGGGLRPLEPSVATPTRLAPSFDGPSPLNPTAEGRGAFTFTPSQPTPFTPSLPLATPPAMARPSVGGEMGTPGIQTRTLPW